MAIINKPTVKTRNSGVISGVDKHVTGEAKIGGVTYAPHKQWQDQVNVTRAAGRRAHAVYLLLRSFLIGQYGNDANAVLNDFGMVIPKTRGAKTVKANAIGVAKRTATRAVRHTMGKKQRKTVVGTVAEPTAAPGNVPTAAEGSPAAPTLARARSELHPDASRDLVHVVRPIPRAVVDPLREVLRRRDGTLGRRLNGSALRTRGCRLTARKHVIAIVDAHAKVPRCPIRHAEREGRHVDVAIGSVRVIHAGARRATIREVHLFEARERL